MSIVQANKENIKKAAYIIRTGGLAAFPTETVYGLGANAYDPVAVSSIFEVKKRPSFDPLIVHIASFSTLEEITQKTGELEIELAREFWPGPLTLILPKKQIIPDIVTAGLNTVGVRMPANETARELIIDAGVPIAAPSANPFGRISPTKAEHVWNQLGQDVDIIIDGGTCEMGIESTIIKVVNNIPEILRYGSLTIEEIKSRTGITNLRTFEENNKAQKVKPEAPGQMPYHYSPNTPLILVEDIEKSVINPGKSGYLAFKKPLNTLPFSKIEILSETGNMREAAANLFSSLHNLDSAGLDIIYAEIVPMQGLGFAIMDRLKKAAAGNK